MTTPQRAEHDHLRSLDHPRPATRIRERLPDDEWTTVPAAAADPSWPSDVQAGVAAAARRPSALSRPSWPALRFPAVGETIVPIWELSPGRAGWRPAGGSPQSAPSRRPTSGSCWRPRYSSGRRTRTRARSVPGTAAAGRCCAARSSPPWPQMPPRRRAGRAARSCGCAGTAARTARRSSGNCCAAAWAPPPGTVLHAAGAPVRGIRIGLGAPRAALEQAGGRGGAAGRAGRVSPPATPSAPSRWPATNWGTSPGRQPRTWPQHPHRRKGRWCSRCRRVPACGPHAWARAGSRR